MKRLIVLLAGAAALTPGTAAAAAPAPCGGSAHVTDAAGDGHHANTDVTRAWFAESAGRVQAVVEVVDAVWEPVHDDSDAAVLAVIWTAGGAQRYVRVRAQRGGVQAYDHGAYADGRFTSAGPTTGAVVAGTRGTATLDLPAVAGTLAAPFVLTSDGADGPERPHWVDRAPGGTGPAGTEAGADFVVGSCTQPAPVPAPPPGTGPPLPPATAPLTGVTLKAPARLVGGGVAMVSGAVRPARAGVAVELVGTAVRRVVRRLTTAADGSFTARVPLAETTRLRATAGGLGSQTLTVRVASRVRLALRRLRDGGALVTGTVRPALPGRILLLRTVAASPSATGRTRAGAFRLRLKSLRPGSYQAVFVPSAGRAERSTSNPGALR